MDVVEHSRTHGLSVAIGFILTLLPTYSVAQLCPPFLEGVTEKATLEGIVLISVAKARALSTDPGSMEIAQAEARLEARRRLLTHPLLQKLGKNTLRGAMDVSTCVRGEDAYAVVKVSEKSIKQASTLQEAVSNSLSKSPTPQPSSTHQGT